MFQLIVAVISIALVAALAIASIYYGGQAFQKSSLKANVTTLVNGAQQISGADALYKTSNGGVGAASLAALTAGGEYLNGEPGKSGAVDDAAVWAIESVAASTLGVVDDAGTTTVDESTVLVRVASILLNTAIDAEVCAEVATQAGGDVIESQFGCNADTSKFVFKL